jgi:glycosyltransferase involved in cell wall biosynthesis
MKKRIAIVINTSWNIYNFRLGLLNVLKEEGHEIICIAPKDDYSKKLEEFGFKYYDININNKGTNPIEDLKLTKEFYNIYRKVKPDVILQYTIKPNIYGSIAARLLKIPVISNISGLGTVFLNNNLSSKIARFLYRIALKKNTVFFQNNDDKNLFIKNKILKEEQTDLVAGSGINTNIFKTNKQINKESITFLFIARLVKDKGILEYIEAIKKIENKSTVKFKILGSLYRNNPTAISQDELDEWINKGTIEYLGHSDNVKEEIEKADCIVLPSYREGLSKVLLEASSLERPIITTNTPGCRDVVTHGVNGFLCEVRNSNDLKIQIEKMINLPYQDRLEMGKKGRVKIIEEFEEQIVIDKYLTFINK